MGFGHKIILGEDMSYGNICLLVRQVLLEDESYRRSYFENMSNGKTCLHIGIFYRKIVLLENTSNSRTGLTGGYVL